MKKETVMAYPRSSRGFRVNYVTYPHAGLAFDDETRTQQEFKDECDINQIMARYQKNGELPRLMASDPQYADFSEPLEFQEAMNIVAKAGEQFAALPARVRERFHNDPQKFLEFASDGRNAEALASMGLMQPEAVKRVSDEKAARKKKEFDEAVEKRVEEKSREK